MRYEKDSGVQEMMNNIIKDYHMNIYLYAKKVDVDYIWLIRWKANTNNNLIFIDK